MLRESRKPLCNCFDSIKKYHYLFIAINIRYTYPNTYSCGICMFSSPVCKFGINWINCCNLLIISPAEIAQLVERNLAKVEVAGPSPVFRSTEGHRQRWPFFVCVNGLCCSGRAVPLFWSALDFAAEFRKIGRNEGDFGGVFYTMFNTERQYLLWYNCQKGWCNLYNLLRFCNIKKSV